MFLTRNNLPLSLIGIQIIIFTCASVIIVCIYDPTQFYKENAKGFLFTHPHVELYSEYFNLDQLTSDYCNMNADKNKTESIIIGPYIWTSCTETPLHLTSIDILLLVILGISSCSLLLSMICATCFDIYNKNYKKIILGICIIICLIVYNCLYFMRYQPLTSNYFDMVNIGPGSMIGIYDAKTKINTCRFKSTFEFKSCYCQLIHLNSVLFMNVTRESSCSYSPNMYLVGIILSGAGYAIFFSICCILHVLIDSNEMDENNDEAMTNDSIL